MDGHDDPEILFNGRFAADALRLVNPGGWYIGVQSPTTKKVYAILPEPTGTGRIRLGGTGEVTITNPETGDIETLPADALIVFQAATALPQEPVRPE